MLKGSSQWQEIAGPYVHRKERVGNVQEEKKFYLALRILERSAEEP